MILEILLASFSFLGCCILIARKIPILLSVPSTPPESTFLKLTKKGINWFLALKFFKKEFWELKIQSFLRKCRIVILRLDALTFKLLLKLNEKEKEKREKEKEDYWEKIKNIKE
ncbi:hypothetical protein H5T58_01835 [Candidatus Parcubacteria bacterium]|nr:hypothetical protein [Candidatus Parcubacteria bacterium]